MRDIVVFHVYSKTAKTRSFDSDSAKTVNGSENSRSMHVKAGLLECGARDTRFAFS